VSGALAFQEEAKQEALQELWKCAVAFDPDKQCLQMRVVGSNAIFWKAVLGKDLSLLPMKKRYSNFWIWATMRIRGRVLDFFRAQRLITRAPKRSDPDAPRQVTMLYKDRFLSANSPVLRKSSEVIGDVISSYFDLFPAKETADAEDEANDQKKQISAILGEAGLNNEETQVVSIYYSDRDMSRAQIAEELGRSTIVIGALLKSALEKMRLAADRLAIYSR
jgi:RNA polymerase sigma factor (sigma-70 family)